MVSVIMATYNRNELLFERALPSVFAQTYQDFEVTVVADGMREPESTELDQLALVYGSRLRVFHIPRQSYPEDPGQKWCVLGLNARNHALDNAQGEWIAPLDDDDAWTPDHLAVLLHQAKSNGVDFAYGQSAYHWPDGRPQTAGKWPPGFGAFCDGAQIYRNGMGYRYDPRCIERGLPEDADLWIRMVEGGVTFSFLPKIVHHYYPNQR